MEVTTLLARKLPLFLLPVLLVAQYRDAYAQNAKLPRVGVPTTLSPDRPPLKGLRDGLDKAGYVIGKNLHLEITHRTDLIELTSVARKFVEDQFDVIVTIGSRDTGVVQQVSKKTPIVFLLVDDPIGRGFVKSYARPNTNLTGLSRFHDIEDNGKLLELLKEMVPTLKSVTVISDGRVTDKFTADQARSIRRVAMRQGLHFGEKHARSEAEIFRIISALDSGPEQGVLLNCTALFADLKRSSSKAIEKRIPLQGCVASHVIDDGALFSYAPDLYQLGQRGAWYVDRILKGAKPEDMPVEAPRRFDLTVNLRTANTIRLKIPPEALQLADQVIE